MAQIELTQHEANVLLGLLDIATKAGGLGKGVAADCIYFAGKLEKAFATPDHQPTPPVETTQVTEEKAA